MRKYSLLDPNWLAHKINNQVIHEHLSSITGCVYDLGCGTRPYEADIRKNSQSYIGIDWSNTIHDLHADIIADLNTYLPIENEVADNVVSFQVLEHLSEPQIMLNEAFRILKPNGKIFLSVPFQWWVHESPHDFFRYTRYGLEYMFQKSGFIEIKIEALTGFWRMWFLKLNYQLFRVTKFGPKPFRFITRLLLTPIWLLNQYAAIALDTIWPNSEGETAWYFVTGRKP